MGTNVIICSIEGCERKKIVRGWCNRHYYKWQKTGDPLGQTRKGSIELFWDKVDKDGPVVESELGNCWIWTACHNQDGYGRFNMNGRLHSAHRISYEWMVEAIPEGKELDHLCKVRDCVRPTHLRPLTHKENVMIGESFAVANAAKTHCPRGHEYSYENTYRPPKGGRWCRTCGRASTKAWLDLNRERYK